MSIPSPLLPKLKPASEPRPVVRATLACRYCTARFQQDFTAEDDLQDDIIQTYIPAPWPVANVKRARRARRAFLGMFWPKEEVEEVRVTLACPNCGHHNCGVVKRESILAAPSPSVTLSCAPPHFDAAVVAFEVTLSCAPPHFDPRNATFTDGKSAADCQSRRGF